MARRSKSSCSPAGRLHSSAESTHMNGLLQDKVALITGAASGIGRASAQLFARQGAKVVGADITQAAGEEAAQSIRAEGGDAIFVRTDVGVLGDVQAAVEKTVAQYGRLD